LHSSLVGQGGEFFIRVRSRDIGLCIVDALNKLPEGIAGAAPHAVRVTGGLGGPVMRRQGKALEHKPGVFLFRHQLVHSRLRLLAMRTLQVTELDDGDWSVRWPA